MKINKNWISLTSAACYFPLIILQSFFCASAYKPQYESLWQYLFLVCPRNKG